jgi:hypothetical protein
MPLCSELADIEWLTGNEAGALLDELAEDSGPLHTAVARLRSQISPAQTHLLLEQVELRRRAAAKFTQAQKMLFTRRGLEQATDEWVARYKANRFAAQPAGASSTPAGTARTTADLCCGIGGDLVALTNCATAIGIDRDPVSAHLAAANSGAQVYVQDATDFCFDGIDAWHIDPDRRPTGHRTTSLDWCEPDLAIIEKLLARSPHAAVKLAPACRPPAKWVDQCELEWISRDRECRQLVAWHGNLALAPGRRRATLLLSALVAGNLPPRTIVGEPNHAISIVGQADRYIFDIDPAIIAARLTGALADEHGLNALGAGPTYLTGPGVIDDAALACFEIDDVLPLRASKLAQHLRARSIGQLEIKKRGVEIEPEKLRRELKLHGSNAATLLVTPIAGRPAAIFARRVSN